MALKWKGRVRETSITTGTGALTLGGAVTSYGTFASLMSTGDTCYGTVAHRTTTEWEDCLFTMAADGTLQRTTVIDGSSGAGTPVSLSAGTKDVFLGLPPAIVETLLGASLVTLGSTAYATSERVLTAGSGISLTDGGAGSTLTVAATGSYTDEQAQDAVGGILVDSSTIDFTYNDGTPSITATVLVAGLSGIDHGSQLAGLSDDDHTQYALLAGRSSGQTLIGGTASGNNLTFQSTSHATRGVVSFTDRPSASFGSGTLNERFGASSGRDAATGTYNTAIGPETLSAVTSGSYNTACGGRGMIALTTGSYNTSVGYGAMQAGIVTGQGNFAMGLGSLQVLASGSANVATGRSTLQLLTTGSDNTAIGEVAAGGSGVNIQGTVAIGSNAGYYVKGNYCIHIGYASYSLAPTTASVDCVGIGRYALYSVTSGAGNIQIGKGLLTGVLATGSNNILIGYEADAAAASTADGIALGRSAVCASAEFALGPYITAQTFYGLSSTSTLAARAAFTPTVITNTHASRTYGLSIGAYYTSTLQQIVTLAAHASGVRFSTTTINGYLTSPGGLTAGAFNEVYGQGAGAALASGATNNTLAGYGAGAAVSTSDDHTIIGYLTAPTLTTGGGCTIIGSGADVYNATDNGAVVIGHGARSGDGCVAVGRSAVAQGTTGVAVGKSASAGGSLGVAIGTLCLAANTDGIVIGDTQQTGASYQTLIGRQLSGDGAGSFCFGHKSQDTFLSWLRDTSGVGSGTAKAQIRIVPGWDVSTEGSQMGKVSHQVMDVTTARTFLQAIATSGAMKVGFFGATPVVKPATTGTVTGHTGGGGTALTHSDTFTGNTGATAYTIGDIVKALKDLGLLTA